MSLAAACLFPVAFLQAGTVVTQPFRGVTYIVRSEAVPRNVTMHIAVIDLRAPGIQLKLTTPGGTRDAVRETTLDFLNREQAQVAINCHFMLPFPSLDTNVNVVGLAASQGAIYSPFESQPIGTDYVDQSYAILPQAPALNISRRGRAGIVHPDLTRPGGTNVVEGVKLWNVVSGSALIVSNGVKTIPSYSTAAGGLKALNGYSDLNSWYARVRARTAIGVTVDRRTLVLFTVDETGGSGGMTVGEVADVLLRDYDVHNALNLDGGGSTTMAMQDPMSGAGRVVNASSDNPLGRAVGTSLAVFAKPILDCTMRPSIALTATNTVLISWPATSKRWQLQETFGQGSTRWTDVSATPLRVDDRMQVVLEAQAAAVFYRLSR